MDMLSLAIKTRLPFIHVKTDDIIHTQEVLTWIAETEVYPWNGFKPGDEGLTLPSADVLYTSNEDLARPEFWLKFKEANKTVVFVNTKPSVLFFNGGLLFPPKAMVEKYLSDMIKDPDIAKDVSSCYGGLTLKDVFEVTKLTLKSHGELTTHGVNETRQGYITKLKGITQVDSDMEFYQQPTNLAAWMKSNLSFFKNPIHPSLTPRGLLFDGPPGTGKTAGAKCIANELKLPLYRMDVGAMKGKYVGDSEGNLNAALQQIDQVAPCVVILDEVEKLFSGNTKDSSGVTSSMLSGLLWWLQEHKTQVFTVMTTNDRGSIPPELYREGRIDATMMFLGLENMGQAKQFAEQTLGFLKKALDIKTPDNILLAEVEGQLKQLFASGDAVPQAKVSQIVHSVVKAMLANKE